MNYPIEKIEGIGPANAKKLAAAGINTTQDLLDRCTTPIGRGEVAVSSGLSAKLLLTWANMADLTRISGIGEGYSQLLEVVGVNTVRELRNRNADNLVAKMTEVNEQRKLTRRVPAVHEVGEWIEQAKGLQPLILY